MRRRAAPLLAALGAALLLLAPAATAQTGVDLALERVQLDEDGTTSLTVNVTGPLVPDLLPADAFAVTEDGQPVDDLDVAPLGETVEVEVEPATVLILFDVSGSTEGEPIAAARDAAAGFAQALVDEQVAVGLIPFGTDAELVLAPTDDADALVTAIQGMEAGGNTALYDAIVLGAEVLADVEGERSLVLFTDGADTTSDATLDEAVDAAVAAEAPILNVALLTDDQDPEVLDALAVRTDGQLVEVEDTDQLAAAFEQVAEGFAASRYVLTYQGATMSDDLDVAVTVDVDGVSAGAEATVRNPRVIEEELPAPPPVTPRDPGMFGGTTGLYVGIGLAFAALALLLVLLIVPRGDAKVSRTLRRGLTMVERKGEEARPTEGLSASALGRSALKAIQAVPKPKGYDERLQLDIDRAGWQLRASEFTILRLAITVGGGALLWALTGNWFLGLVGAVAGFYVPRLVLDTTRRRRQAKFMDQLPDTLQLLAGTLKAGYGVLQGIDTIVKEMGPPTATEFRRVLTEARLGLPLEDSLNDMAERIGTDDFRWVVVSMNIQRQIGGNLAELLETLANTLRERVQVRRQIDVLAGEGKLSAVILSVLPFVLLLYLAVVNPTYLAALFAHTAGLIMGGLALVLMMVGILWMRRLIRIEV